MIFWVFTNRSLHYSNQYVRKKAEHTAVSTYTYTHAHTHPHLTDPEIPTYKYFFMVHLRHVNTQGYSIHSQWHNQLHNTSLLCKNMNTNRISCQIVWAVNSGKEERQKTKSSGFAEFKFCLFWLIKVYNLATTTTNIYQECVAPLWVCKQSCCNTLSAWW